MGASMVSGLALILAGFSEDITQIGVLFTLWSISSELILTFINTIPVLFFPKHMVQRVFALLVCSQSIYSIFQPMLFALHGSWRVGCIASLGIPHLLLGIYTFIDISQLSNVEIEEKGELEPMLANPEEGFGVQDSTHVHNTSMTNIKLEERVTYRDIMDSRHFRNILFYLFVYGGSYVAAMSSLLTLNSLSGNIYVNLTVVYIIE
jgi:hypothetical protein